MRGAARSGAPEAGLRHLGFFAWEARPFRAEPLHLCLEVGRRRLGRLQGGDFFQQFAIGSFVFLKPAINSREFFVATFGSGFRFVTAFHQRPFFLLKPGQRGRLLPGVLLPLGVDMFERFFDLRDPDRDLLLFLLEFFQGHDFVPHFRELRRLRGAFPAQGDLGFLQETLLVLQGHARPLPAHFQRQLPETRRNKTHKTNLGAVIPPRCLTLPER